MNLYLITTTDAGEKYVTYDSYDAHVVRAATPKQARALCPHADEGDIWDAPYLSRTERLATDVKGKPGVILSSFNAG